MKETGVILQYICLFCILFIGVIQDIRMRKIKNKVSAGGALAGLVFAVLLPQRHILDAFLGFFIMLAVGMFCWRLKVFRAGDAKLLCAVASFTDWKMGINTLLVAVIFGAVAGLPMVIGRIWKKEGGKTAFPFSVAIAAGCIFGIVFGYIWEILEYM